MSVIARGTRNAFRNSIRTVSIVAILALSIALAVVMLLSVKAVEAKTDDVKSSVGNTITVTPAGSAASRAAATRCRPPTSRRSAATPHVVSATGSVAGPAAHRGLDSTAASFGNSNANAIDEPRRPRSRRARSASRTTAADRAAAAAQAPAGFSLPITVTGTTDPTSTQVSDVSSFKHHVGHDDRRHQLRERRAGRQGPRDEEQPDRRLDLHRVRPDHHGEGHLRHREHVHATAA